MTDTVNKQSNFHLELFHFIMPYFTLAILIFENGIKFLEHSSNYVISFKGKVE